MISLTHPRVSKQPRPTAAVRLDDHLPLIVHEPTVARALERVDARLVLQDRIAAGGHPTDYWQADIDSCRLEVEALTRLAGPGGG